MSPMSPLWTIDDDDPDSSDLEEAFKAEYGPDDDEEIDDTMIVDTSARALFAARLDEINKLRKQQRYGRDNAR